MTHEIVAAEILNTDYGIDIDSFSVFELKDIREKLGIVLESREESEPSGFNIEG